MDLFKQFKTNLESVKEEKDGFDEEQMHKEIEEFSGIFKEFVHERTMSTATKERKKIDDLRKALQDKWNLSVLNIEISITVSVERTSTSMKTSITTEEMSDIAKGGHKKLFEDAKNKLAKSLAKGLEIKNKLRKPN